MKTWHERLTAAREAKGWNKTQLADAVGKSNPTVSDWESGEIKKLEADSLLSICEALHISPRWLQYGEGSMAANYLDPKIEAVSKAMQTMPEYKKDVLVQTSTALAEPKKGNGTQ